MVWQRIMEGLIQHTTGSNVMQPEWTKVNRIFAHIMRGLTANEKTVIKRNWRVQRDIIILVGHAALWQKPDEKLTDKIINYLLNRNEDWQDFLASQPAKQALGE